ncbi:hypothetical protein J6S37_00170 [Candidatus Saccharibacteria bacterium]|nr:hypothetical protein [Candidatus Saccharibacteria bacterium]
MKKNTTTVLQKTFIILICCAAFLGFLNYEIYSLNKKEYERQVGILNETHEQISLNLNMMKIAIQTNDLGKYAENLSKLRDNSATIESLFLVRGEQEGFLTSLHSYIELLESREKLLSENIGLKQDVLNIEKSFKDNYGGKDAISRDKLTGIGNEIAKLKIDGEKYSEEIVKTIVSAINQVLDEIIAESDALAKCIDSCYKDRITKINDELAEKVKGFASKTEDLNKTIEEQFDFKILDELKKI